ncbi:hypothetical protein Goshw_003509 [Gossypium schwendimanii]|uniref:Reverse transcriptase zinc-binding domain-containing protein n=1 Tax=Gossypium schwendimanii TaxID=34291 RepID=A0A7J9M0J1_GOSSC|nr:hypothetical protein [Gossypium schwendimanii]
MIANAERFRRGMGSSFSCSICGTTEESILRVLRDYCKACEVCKQIILVGVWPLNFSTSLFEWVTANLRNDFELAFGEVDWPSLFGIICWKLWKQRNSWVFQGEPFNMHHILPCLWCWARSKVHRSVASVGNSARNTQNREQRPPLSEYIKVNTDGVRNLGLGLASATTW